MEEEEGRVSSLEVDVAVGGWLFFWESVGKPGELIVGDATGVWKTRTRLSIASHTANDRSRRRSTWYATHPWRPCDDDPSAECEMPQGVKLETLTGHEFQETVKDDQSMSRRVYLNKNDFEEHGYSSSLPWMPLDFEGHRTAGRQ